MRSIVVLVALGVASFVACGARVDTAFHGAACVDTYKRGCIERDTCSTTTTGCGGVQLATDCTCVESGSTTAWQCGHEGQDAGCPQGANDCTKPVMAGQPCTAPGTCKGADTPCGPSTCDCNNGSTWKCSEPLCAMDAGVD